MTSSAAADPDATASAWIDAFRREVLWCAHKEDVSNEEVFADVYHSLIHSEHSATLLQLEHSHAEQVGVKWRQQQQERAGMDERQDREMAEAVEKVAAEAEAGDGDDHHERAINGLAAQHMEERQMAQMRWDSDLSHTRDTQCREFREWVMCVHEEVKTATESPAKRATASSSSPSGGAGVPRTESSFSMSSMSTAPALQESFTITLGAQMKQMHNLRLAAADLLRLLAYPAAQEEALPQRLQTSMALYSHNLSGVVLLTDGRVSSYSSAGLSRDFADLCQQSTEFHFPPFEQQLQAVRDDYMERALAWREDHRRRLAESEFAAAADEAAASAAAAGDRGPDKKYGRASNRSLRSGDFYVTKHSNLCETHVVFHMASDDSVLSGGINSRHPVVMGLRNVLKTASLSDVTTVTLPLLLAHDLTEEMTVPWCMKRAELVFKCVKGFMMEVASWGGSEIKTLQFLLPKHIDPDVFNRLTSMLAGIFRTSNPIRGK